MNGNTTIPPAEYPYIVLRRSQGETLQSIADSYGCSRERIRQIVKQVDPEVPGKIKDVRARRIREEQEAQRELEFYARCSHAIINDLRCAACGSWVLRGNRAITCSEECAEAYKILRYVDDPQAHRINMAKVYAKNPEKYAGVRQEWAESVLSGENTERNRNYLIPGSKRAKIIKKYRPELYKELTS